MNNTSNAASFMLLIEQNKGILYKISGAYCSDKEARKDLMQDMILQLWRTYDHFDKAYKWTTWMYRVCLNVAISHVTLSRKKTIPTDSLGTHIMNLPDLSEDAQQDERLEELYSMIAQLKEMDRGILILYLEGKSHKEICQILGISTTNVSTRMLRIKNQLKRQFNQK